MYPAANHPIAYVALNDRTLCASLELSHKTWVLTVLSPWHPEDVEVLDSCRRRRCFDRTPWPAAVEGGSYR